MEMCSLLFLPVYLYICYASSPLPPLPFPASVSLLLLLPQTLLSQANTRRLKKDRKREIKDALSRYQVLEDRLQDMKKAKRGSMGSSSSARFHVDSPS